MSHTATGTTGDQPATTPSRFPDRTGRAGLWQALHSEWTKLRTVRSTTWTLAAMAAATVGTTVLVALTNSLHPADTVLSGSLGNAVLGELAAGVLGVLVVCGEYSSGAIRATFTANPRRMTVLAAKALTVAAVVVTVAFAAALGAYLLGGVLLSGRGHPPGEPMPALLGIAVSHAAVAVLGVALGTALRHTAGAITAVIGLLLLPTLLGPLLGDAQQWITGASPLAALQKLAQPSGATAETLGALGAWPTLWLICAYTSAVLAASAALLHLRDT